MQTASTRGKLYPGGERGCGSGVLLWSEDSTGAGGRAGSEPAFAVSLEEAVDKCYRDVSEWIKEEQEED